MPTQTVKTTLDRIEDMESDLASAGELVSAEDASELISLVVSLLLNDSN